MARHEAIDGTAGIISINSKSFFVEYSEPYNGCCSKISYIVGVDKNGHRLFRTQITENIIKIVRTKDDCIFGIGYDIKSCDIVPHRDFYFKVDTNGVVKFNIAMQNNFVGFYTPYLTDFTQHSDSSYYFAMITSVNLPTQKIQHYSKNGVFIASTDSSFSSINSITSLSNGNLLVNGVINGTLSNVEITTTGTITNQQVTQNKIVKFIETPSAFYGQTSTGNLESFNHSLTPIGVYTTSPVKDFIIRNDSLFVTGVVPASSSAFYKILNPNFIPIYQTTSATYNIRPTGITLRDNKVDVVATSTSHTETPMSFSDFYALDLNGTLERKYDIGVSDFTVTSSYINYSYGVQGTAFPVYYVDAKITNYGSVAVNSFYLNHYSFVTWCNNIFHRLYNVTILPGASVVVQTGSFIGKNMGNLGNAPQGTAIDIPVCLFTTVPDSSADKDISNDYTCKTISFGYLDLNRLTENEESIQVFPSPFSDILTINSEKQIKTITLTNLFGKRVLQYSEVNAKSFGLSEVGLDPGIYFMSIETETGQVVRKIIKD